MSSVTWVPSLAPEILHAVGVVQKKNGQVTFGFLRLWWEKSSSVEITLEKEALIVLLKL